MTTLSDYQEFINRLIDGNADGEAMFENKAMSTLRALRVAKRLNENAQCDGMSHGKRKLR